MKTDRPPTPIRGPGGWFVVQQHEDVEVVRAAERPSINVEKGERMKTVRGPYETEERAKEEAGRLERKTLRYHSSKGGR